MIIRICSSSGVRETIEGLGYRDEDRGLRTRVKVNSILLSPFLHWHFLSFPLLCTFFLFSNCRIHTQVLRLEKRFPPPKRVPIHTQVLGLDEFFTNGSIHTRFFFFLMWNFSWSHSHLNFRVMEVCFFLQIKVPFTLKFWRFFFLISRYI